jgi:hypothetical protein
MAAAASVATVTGPLLVMNGTPLYLATPSTIASSGCTCKSLRPSKTRERAFAGEGITQSSTACCYRHTHIHARISIRARIHSHTHTHTHTQTHTHYTHTHATPHHTTHTLSVTHTHTHTHTYTHTRKHAHTHGGCAITATRRQAHNGAQYTIAVEEYDE